MPGEQRVAIVTGAGRGIGKAIVERFARDGHALVLTSTDGRNAEDVARVLGAQGCEAIAVGADLADTASPALIVDRAMQRFGRVDILVNNAGVTSVQKLADVTLAEWHRVLAIDLTACLLMAQTASPHMVARRWGRIINVSSFFGLRAFGARTSYGTAKAAVLQLTRQLAVELAPHGVTANAIAPGVIDTEMSQRAHTPEVRARWQRIVPMGRYGRPEEIAGCVAFLASDDAAYMTGTTMVVDGGGEAAIGFDGTGG
ncbi:MAG: oxidoreductase [Rhodospirillales bacterium]|nr:oxidoreductase [Rhodospirillales bacterium]